MNSSNKYELRSKDTSMNQRNPTEQEDSTVMYNESDVCLDPVAPDGNLIINATTSESTDKDESENLSVSAPTWFLSYMSIFSDSFNTLKSQNDNLKSNLDQKLDTVKYDISNEIKILDKRFDEQELKFENLKTDIGLRFDAQDLKLEIQSQNCLAIRDELLGLIENNKCETLDIMNEQLKVNKDFVKTEVTSVSQIFQEKLNSCVEVVNDDLNKVKHDISSLNEQMNDKVRDMDTKLEIDSMAIIRFESEHLQQIQSIKSKVNTLESELKNLKISYDVKPKVNVYSNECPSNKKNNLSSNAVTIQSLSDNQNVILSSSNDNISTPGDMEIRNCTSFDFPLPRFTNHPKDNPVVFISELESYFLMKVVPESLKMILVGKSLKAEPKSWFNVIVSSSPKPIAFCDFKTLFLAHYWSSERQYQMRSQINQGKYDAKVHGTITDYFLCLVEKSKFLKPPISESELISSISQHYDPMIHAALVVGKPQSIMEMLELLRALQISSVPHIKLDVYNNNANQYGDRKNNSNRGNGKEYFESNGKSNYYYNKNEGDNSINNKEGYDRQYQKHGFKGPQTHENSNYNNKSRTFYSNNQKGNRYSDHNRYYNNRDDKIGKQTQDEHIRFFRTYRDRTQRESNYDKSRENGSYNNPRNERRYIEECNRERGRNGDNRLQSPRNGRCTPRDRSPIRREPEYGQRTPEKIRQGHRPNAEQFSHSRSDTQHPSLEN